MRPEFLRNDVDTKLLRDLRRILTEVPDIPEVLASPIVGLLDGSMDAYTACLALYGWRGIGRRSVHGSLYRHVQDLLNFFAPGVSEVRTQRPGPDRDYRDRRCRCYLAHIRALLNTARYPYRKT